MVCKNQWSGFSQLWAVAQGSHYAQVCTGPLGVEEHGGMSYFYHDTTYCILKFLKETAKYLCPFKC